MTLPIAVIERLFDRLSMNYGTEFKNKWNGLPLNEVKTTWAHELSWFADDLTAIGWALQNLPEKCPNLVEFKNLCKQAPKQTQVLLNAPKASAEIVDAQIQKIAQLSIKSVTDKADHKLWAKKLKERHEKGEKLNFYQVLKYKEALEIA